MRIFMTEKIGILALGHGSRHPHNKEVVNGVAELIAKKYKNTVVRIGFMNMNTPTMKEGMVGVFIFIKPMRTTVFLYFLAMSSATPLTTSLLWGCLLPCPSASIPM